MWPPWASSARASRLPAGVRPDGDAMVDGRTDQLAGHIGGLEVEVLVLRVAYEKPASFEPPRDAY